MDEKSKKQRALGDYEVGYCRPPQSTRFTAERNPKGRRKGSKNYATILREKLNAKVTVREGGRSRRMSKAEMGMTKLANQFAEKGDWKAFLAIIRFLDGPGSDQGGAAERPGNDTETAASSETMVDWFIENLRGGAREDDPEGGEE